MDRNLLGLLELLLVVGGLAAFVGVDRWMTRRLESRSDATVEPGPGGPPGRDVPDERQEDNR